MTLGTWFMIVVPNTTASDAQYILRVYHRPDVCERDAQTINYKVGSAYKVMCIQQKDA
jgi:hypothetical protein